VDKLNAYQMRQVWKINFHLEYFEVLASVERALLVWNWNVSVWCVDCSDWCGN